MENKNAPSEKRFLVQMTFNYRIQSLIIFKWQICNFCVVSNTVGKAIPVDIKLLSKINKIMTY